MGCNVYTKDDCKDCFARFYCSGGCAANAYHFQKDVKGSYEIGCELPTDEASLLAAGEAFKAYGDDYYPLALGEYDRAIFLVYY